MASANQGNGVLPMAFGTVAILAAGAAFFFGYSLKTQTDQRDMAVNRLIERTESLEKSLASANQSLAGLQSQFAADKSLIAEISGQMSDLRSQVNPIKDQIASTGNRLDSVQSRLESMAPKFEGVTSDLDGVNDVVQSTQSIIEQLRIENKSLTDKHNLLTQDQQKLVESINGLTSVVDNFQLTTESLAGKLNLLESSNLESFSKLQEIEMLVESGTLNNLIPEEAAGDSPASAISNVLPENPIATANETLSGVAKGEIPITSPINGLPASLQDSPESGASTSEDLPVSETEIQETPSAKEAAATATPSNPFAESVKSITSRVPSKDDL